MKVVLIRHGKTQGNVEGRYIGITDEPLLEETKKELAEKKYNRLDHIYSSPMKRCIETCEICYSNVLRTVIKGFREIDFGIFENLNYEELNGNPIYQKWIDSYGTMPIPNGEAIETFKARCCKAFLECIQNACENEYNEIGFVIHGGTIMAIMERFSDYNKQYFDWKVSNGEGYRGKFNLSKLRLYDIKNI